MIIELEGFPNNVVAVQASGLVTGADYAGILVPAVERKFAEFDKVRLLYQIGPDFKRFTTTALWEDTKIGLHHLHGFERIAVISDIAWIIKLVNGISKAMPAQTQCFSLAETEAAKHWILEQEPGSTAT